MIDPLNKYDFWNNLPAKYTQTKYLRFLNAPESRLKTSYWNDDKNKDLLRTAYSPYLEKFL
uniref:Uncharacterized protein n=1 Tax=viral metagenome TaxID=1070528 RepID=A0A6M3IRC5_9ZZZZ